MLHTVNHLTSSLGVSSTVERAGLADKLVESDRLFEDTIHGIAVRNDMLRNSPEMRCPCCGLSHCTGAVPVTILSPSLVQALKDAGFIP